MYSIGKREFTHKYLLLKPMKKYWKAKNECIKTKIIDFSRISNLFVMLNNLYSLIECFQSCAPSTMQNKTFRKKSKIKNNTFSVQLLRHNYFWFPIIDFSSIKARFLQR